MAYVSFVSDEHLMKCIEKLYEAYEKAKNNYDIKDFYHNQIDPFKLMFDMKFFDMTPEEKIKAEINRKIDKTISNAIGEFHENVLGGIKGYKNHPVGAGYDVTDDKLEKLFADIKNKHNTVKGKNLRDLYAELESYIKDKKDAKAYWVQIISSGSSFNTQWTIPSHNKNNSNVYKISADKFYEVLTGDENAFFELCNALPKAVDDFLAKKSKIKAGKSSDVYDKLKKKCDENKRTFEMQLMYDTFKNYNGFSENKK